MRCFSVEFAQNLSVLRDSAAKRSFSSERTGWQVLPGYEPSSSARRFWVEWESPGLLPQSLKDTKLF
jgi:hypothetical protein